MFCTISFSLINKTTRKVLLLSPFDTYVNEKQNGGLLLTLQSTVKHLFDYKAHIVKTLIFKLSF